MKQRLRIAVVPLMGVLRNLLIGCLLATFAQAAVGQAPTRGAEITEDRVALVIGNSTYRFSPLPNPVNDARLLADRLRQAGFKVILGENLDRRGLFNALRDFGNQLNERTIAVFFYAGHALQLRDRNYMLPVDMDMPRSEDEIPINAIDVSFILGRMSHARSRINIVILDACRDNPFAGATGPKVRGLAQTDAPVGTLLAFATAPGKVAEDGSGDNSVYTKYLARHILTPGLPVELMFKRVRESVVRDTQATQVPWESSSLQGEFAFVPGATQSAQSSEPDLEAAGELAFWDSVQKGGRLEEYRAYLRQYPNGRFVSLAQTRIAALTRNPAAPSAPSREALLLAKGGRPDLLPRPGDTWRYRVQDQFRIGDLFMTATVNQLTADGVMESWSSTSDPKLRTAVVPIEPGFIELPGWSLTPPEFSPYLLASGPLQDGQRLGEAQRQLERTTIPLRATVEGREMVVVAAGRFEAIKVIVRGQSPTRGSARSGPVSAEHVIWYAPEAKRFVKYVVSTRIGGRLQESTIFELVEYQLN